MLTPIYGTRIFFFPSFFYFQLRKCRTAIFCQNETAFAFHNFSHHEFLLDFLIMFLATTYEREPYPDISFFKCPYYWTSSCGIIYVHNIKIISITQHTQCEEALTHIKSPIIATESLNAHPICVCVLNWIFIFSFPSHITRFGCHFYMVFFVCQCSFTIAVTYALHCTNFWIEHERLEFKRPIPFPFLLSKK